jgi:hypothetical protein
MQKPHTCSVGASEVTGNQKEPYYQAIHRKHVEMIRFGKLDGALNHILNSWIEPAQFDKWAIYLRYT